MLGTFPKDFPKWQLPKRIFPSGNIPNVQFLQAATSQVFPSRSARPPACSSRGGWPPNPSYPQCSAPIAACDASEGLT